MVVGRGSSIERLFRSSGFDLKDYDALFAKKLDLLSSSRERVRANWSGAFPAAPDRAGHLSEARSDSLPIWVGVGGTRNRSSAPAAWAAADGGDHRRRNAAIQAAGRSLREAGKRAGHRPSD